MDLKEKLQTKLIELGGRHILIHSDIMQGLQVPFFDRASILSSHSAAIKSLCTGIDIWMPAFNYEFCKGKEYDVNTTPSQVGVLTEYFRKNEADWRTSIPVFSFTGIGKNPLISISGIVDPFGSASAFNYLYEQDALLMHYGSQIHSSTILHYAERMSDRLNYRYDKIFIGNVKNVAAEKSEVVFSFHVRPLNKHLDYDWIKIELDLIKDNILHIFKNEKTHILLCRIKDLTTYWVNRMHNDPLYLLDAHSKFWVEPMLDKLGRPFLITDFE